MFGVKANEAAASLLPAILLGVKASGTASHQPAG